MLRVGRRTGARRRAVLGTVAVAALVLAASPSTSSASTLDTPSPASPGRAVASLDAPGGPSATTTASSAVGPAAATTGSQVLPSAVAISNPIGTRAPAVTQKPLTDIRGVATSTLPTARLGSQALELTLRFPATKPTLLRSLAVRLPLTMSVAYPRATVQLDGPPARELAVAAITVVRVPKATVLRTAPRVRTVIPPHRLLVITLRSNIVLGKSVALRVWVSRTSNPPTPGTYPLAVTAVTSRGAPSALGVARLVIAAAPGAPCPTTRAPHAIAVENAKAGSSLWSEHGVAGTSLEGYADRTSAQCGDTVSLRISSSARFFTVWAWRLGGYASRGGRLVYRSGPVLGARLSAPVSELAPEPAGQPEAEGPAQGAIEARWRVALRLPITGDFVPGVYLLQIRGSDGGRSWIPLVVRDRAGTPAIGVQLSTSTWQVYNDWGGASGYYGPDRRAETRSRIVSFERPYSGRGDGGLVGSEGPFIRWAESRGYDLTYVTDDDVEAGAPVLRSIRALVVPGHSEYWTQGMRDVLETQVVARGANVAFLGANNVYWRVRRDASPNGPGRRLAIYRIATQDPYGTDPQLASVRWRDAPISRGEQALLGQQYACLGVDAGFTVPAVDPADPGRVWPFASTGVAAGTVLQHLGWGEVDRVWSGPDDPHPVGADVRAIAQNYAPCAGAQPGQTAEWDITGYAVPAGASGPGGGAVLSLGTLGWTCQLIASCPTSRTDPAAATTSAFVTAATATILDTFQAGPAGAVVAHSGSTWSMLPDPAATPVATP